MSYLKPIALSVMLAAGAATTASAASLDFTSYSTFDSLSNAGASGVFNGVGWTITPTPAGALSFGEFVNAPKVTPFAPLAAEFDGLGVNNPNRPDDEITFPFELLTIVFDEEVTITGLYFLDLYTTQVGFVFQSLEAAMLEADGAPAGMFGATQTPNNQNPGLGVFTGLSITGTTFVFSAAAGNDGLGNPDYALAGIDLAPIPLPAGALLLGGALLGMGALRRRNKTTA